MIPGRVLIVAGSDSGGGAGIQADIKTVTMLGGFAMTAITAITAQDTLGVEAVLTIPAEMVLKQFDMVVADLGADVVKIGMIGSADTAEKLAGRLSALSGVPVVFDPVMIASSGSALADAATIAALGRLARIAELTTPNLPELERLTGRSIGTLDELEGAALIMAGTTGRAVLAKGGHLAGDPVVDVLARPDGALCRWTSPRLETRHSHGTGCTLASGIACGLAQGLDLEDSISRARDYLQAALRAPPGLGAGHGPMGHALGTVPFEHIHRKI
ncbi:bifunctional hydroxymethylpyrimidine kinase/phosphomethylpyrimidine kinase [Sphingosinicella sp. CPCC 101087]|uniref:bifunctional hydroxymethylpyrimidine kinase/phosphomethylpyrimidine kinase n=1 Tax=Sphingosinicella sp. CPCC 101087 TaxID=2497754 RepID=UPI00101BFFBF|nr:bifunctional hydroxymethylpyrimidine kinase/phosphomethylpyrimidine kinase [Sphingosinicella sp. CPCC 101087]